MTLRREIEMTWKGRAAALAVLVAVNLEVSGVLGSAIALPLLVVAIAAAWRYTAGFWRIVVSGLVGGALAGLLILGPGFRLAMRAVALMDPTMDPEFTLEGTFFIVIFIGAILGGIQAISGNLLRRFLGIESAVVAGFLLALMVMFGLTFLSGEVSDELFQLGLSPWINIPLFGAIALAYGIAAMALADKFVTHMFPSRRDRREKVPA